jgi:competence protein ComEC
VERLLIFITIILFPVELKMSPPNRWIIWNVGQGEWVTHVTEDRCYHFDMGGEKMPREEIRKACGTRLNLAYFTHWDADHINLTLRARSILPRFCLAQAPLGETSKKKSRYLDGLPQCPNDESVMIWKPNLAGHKKNAANELCQIYRVDRMLIPGDAPAAEEKVYSQSQQGLYRIRWLVLAHHGSRTSSSESFVRSLPNLSVGIASSRFKKYGHPHIEVKERFRFHHIPLLTTEEWGNISLQE